MWEVVGQDRAVSLLQRSLGKGVLAHAYLFVGPHHVGKMTLALDLARAVNCEADESPCGQCVSCQKVASVRHADVQVIGLTSGEDLIRARPQAEIGIDKIRQMQHTASLPPFEGKYKVFIINGAEQLSTEAANCLLKTLEEPVDRIVFILLTVNERLLPSTVISRCQRLELFPLASGEVEAALNAHWGIELQKAKLPARLCHGCLGWAVAATHDDGWLEQRVERVDSLLGIIDADYEERFAYAAKLGYQFGQNRGAVYEVLDLWLDYWRDLLLVKAGCSKAITNVDLEAGLVHRADNYRLSQLKYVIESIRAAGEQLKQNANPQLVLEMLMLGIPGKERLVRRSLAA